MTLLLATTLLCAAAEVDGTATDEDEIDGIDYQDRRIHRQGCCIAT